ncbi:MAG: class I SAM-dependent methyltransferase [Cyanobacteria bacterium P01_F01_bin.150]
MIQKKTQLSGVPKTLLLPLKARAEEQASPTSIIDDPLSVEWLKYLSWDQDLENFYQRMGQIGQTAVAIRTYHHDQIASRHIANCSHPVVVELGVGFSSRFHRVGQQVERWLSLDLSNVIDLRRQIDPENNKHQYIASSVLDLSWMDKIPNVAPKNILFIAEGLLPYFEISQIQQLSAKMKERFSGALLDMEVVGNAVKLSKKSFEKLDAPIKWHVKNEQDVVNLGIKLLNVSSLYQLYPQYWPTKYRLLLKILTKIPYYRNAYLIIETKLA